MDATGVWAFYYIQGEDGEDRSHPNAFKIPAPASGATADVTLADVLRHFPLQHQKTAFHFRFRINSTPKNGSGASTFFWLDVTAPTQKVPLVNGRVICKLLRLERPTKVGLVFRRKPVLKWAGSTNTLDSAAKAPVQPLARQHSSSSDGAPFHRSSSSPAFEHDRPAKYSDSGSATSSRDASGSNRSSRSGSIGTHSKVEQTAPAESFEDFLSGSSSSKAAAAADLMSATSWSDAQPPTLKSSRTDFLSAMDPLSTSNNKATAKSATRASANATAAQPTFEDDNGQTVGPVTMAEMQQHATTTSDGSNVYNAKFVDKSTKSADVRRAMEQRELQVQRDVEKARDELRQRDDAARALSSMKETAALALGPKLKAWAEDNGRTKNIRTLLSTMHLVMWDGAKWPEVNMGKLIQPTDVKKHYRKAMIVVHPDKSGGRSAEQLLIAERVFAAVNTAWDDFVKTNPC